MPSISGGNHYLRSMSITIIIIIITAAISLLAFTNDQLLNGLLLWPARMNGPGQYYRFLTAGFVHADYMHLLFNMFTFYFFGGLLEATPGVGPEKLIILYLTGIIISCIPSFIKKRTHPGYRSLGASGGVAAIIFASIYLAPWNKIYMFFAIGMPSIVFAVLYLAYTAYLARKGAGIVNHDAHLWGSVYGLVFMIIIDPSHGLYFIEQLAHPRF
jgi:membrane associated rhomboid family serine protease